VRARGLRAAAVSMLPMLAMLCLPATTAQAATVAHPRIILDSAKLTALRQRASAGDAAWVALRNQCDSYLTGTVEWPDGNDYPDSNSIGEGYQGSGYLPAVANLGLCYRIAQTLDPAKAAQYGAKGSDLLVHMSAPPGDPHAQDMTRDDVFGIRFYGVGMALGYDWLYEALTADTRTRIYTAIDNWVSTYESRGFGHDHPQGNYFAGYYATKALGALATEGDDPQAATQWTNFLNHVHGELVQPYYAANLSGGGWPEGQQYGPLATFNMILPVLAAKTAKGIDLVHAAAPFTFPSGAANWYIYHLWPDLKRVDDRGTLGEIPEPAPAPVGVITQLAGALATWNDPLAPTFHKFARDVRAANPDGATAPDRLWSDFLFWDPAAPEADYTAKPLANYAQGMEMASFRSSWDKSAVWGSLNAGPYTANPSANHEYYDSGSLAVVRGGTPLLVNATGQLFRGTEHPDTFVINDTYGDRQLYNVFYTSAPSPLGQNTRSRAEGARTRLAAFDPNQNYVFTRASNLEDMYPHDGSASTITSWTRDVTYLRPNLFVINDRTAVTDANLDQWMRFHFAGAPTKVNGTPSGVTQYNIGSGASYAGSVSSVLPVGHREQPTDTIFAGSNVSRIDIRPGAAATANQWLTVVDAAGSPAAAATVSRLTAADGTVQAGAVAGAVMSSSSGRFAVLSGTGPAGTAVTTPIRYHLPAGTTLNVVSDLSPNASYAVTSTPDATGVTVQIQSGSGTKASAAGVLSFTTPTSGGGGTPTCQTSGGDGSFVATGFENNTGTFTAGWDVTPQTATVDGGVALAKGAATDWPGLATTVRFGPDGTVDARDGAGYPASTVRYTAGTTYHVRVQVDVAARTYSAWLKPAGGTEVAIAQGYHFRTEQQGVTGLDNWVVASDGDGLQACNFTVG
jgi:hypothetical protein